MTIVIKQRSFVYRRRIKISAADWDMAATGRKTCTIRLGKVRVNGETVLLSDGGRELRVRILRIDDQKVFRDLADADIACEGYTGLAELENDLRQYYGDVDPNQPMTIIHFSVIN